MSLRKMFLEYLETFCDAEVEGSEVQLKDIVCPFCGEHRSGDLRFYVNIHTLKGICFHCGVGFTNPLSFVQAMEVVDRAGAKRILFEQDEPFAKPELQQVQEAKTIPFPPNAIPALNHPMAKNYLFSRGIGSSLIDHFNIHYCPVDFTYQGEDIYVNKRVIMPIYDIDGGLISWQGRDVTGFKKNKYFFPKGFSSGDYLYNIHNIAGDTVILCEGVFDVFGWVRSGIWPAVASFGKKMSDKQIRMLCWKRVKRLYIGWDGSALGDSYKLAERLRHLFDVRIVDLGEFDADELNRSELVDALNQARPYRWEDKVRWLTSHIA